jgi:cytochrome c5
MNRLVVCLCAALLAACGAEAPSAASPAAAAAAAAATPADPKLARLYAQTCKSCHAPGAGGAPLTGDRAAWQARAAQGMGVLLEHTVAGYKGMPPLGACMACTEKEFEALIRFMAGMDAGP